jgi:hypothetical protein
MDDKNVNKGLNDIERMYKNLGYFDQYAGSVIVFFIITCVIIVITAYCYAKIYIEPIRADWANQRCKPYFIPIAGFINKPDNMTAGDYTSQNFNYCTQNILSSITGYMVQPITFVTSALNNFVTSISQDINSARAMFNKVRTFFNSITQEIMGRIMNIMIPLQKIIIGFKDFIGKIQGVMTAGLFTFLGSFYTMQSLMGAIAESVIIILIAIAAMIVIFWLLPFTWGAAISATATFVAISVPLAIMLVFLMDVLHVQPDLSIPTLKCFDKDTLIYMKNGTYKKIMDIEVGDVLYYDGLVTAKVKVDTKGSVMYKLNDIIVSDTHLLLYKDKWIRIKEHPEAIKLDEYKEPYLYCLNTESKTIYINNILFSDWDELVDDNLMYVLKNTGSGNKMYSREIHKILDGGFFGNTQIVTQQGIKNIKDIQIGDILENGEKVYGVVEIDGTKLIHQYQCKLDNDNENDIYINCGPNTLLFDKESNIITTLTLGQEKKKIIEEDREKILYHLITDKKIFKISGVIFCDYNASIDLFLEKK